MPDTSESRFPIRPERAASLRRLLALFVACTLFACASRLPPQPDTQAPPDTRKQGVVLNDIHSRLNATTVREVSHPETVEQLRALVARANREDLAISISGGRHSMGGQQFAAAALHVDMSRFNRIVSLDRSRGIVTVESGIQWPQLIEGLLAMQPDDPQAWGIVQKQTGADDLSIGGALSSNVHGRGLTLQPFVQDVESFRLLRADGNEIEVSRMSNPEFFRLVAGGYGLFGIVTTVDVRLQRRTRLRRDVEVATIDQLGSRFAQRIADGYTYGDFQFKTDEAAPDFLGTGVFSTYKAVPADTPMRPEQRALTPDDWHRLFVLAHLDKARAFSAYRDYYLGTSGQVYWSDTHQLSYYSADFEGELLKVVPNYPGGSLMITEVYVPRDKLADLMRALASDFRSNRTNLIYGTVRLIEPDRDSFLPWARSNYACVVMNLRVTHTPEGLEKAEREFQLIIDRALERDGSFFLTYHRWARKEQVLRAYPRFVEFLLLKRKYDPEERFQSEWYRHYRTMFSAEMAGRSRR